MLKNNYFSFLTKFFPRFAADITLVARKVRKANKLDKTTYEFGVNIKDYFK